MRLFLDEKSPERLAESTASENYLELQAEVVGTVRSKLSARKMRLDESDLEEAYCQAWHGVCEMIKRGADISNLTGLLVEITWRRAIDEYRASRPSQRVDLDAQEMVVDPDIDAQLDDQIKLKRFLAKARGRLTSRECEVVSLCVIHGYSRAEAADLLDLRPPQLKKLMDGALKKIGGIVASINTRGCGGDEWTNLMQAYALGLVAEDDRDYPRATAHLSECADCSRYVNCLRGLAAILPPVVPLGPATIAGHGASGILAQLESLFRNGHGGGALSGARTVLRTTAGAGAGGAAGGASGSSLAGSLGAGTLAKGVAVLAAAGAAAVTLATHNGKAHHGVTHHRSPAETRTYLPVRASASPVVLPVGHVSIPTKLHRDHAHTRATTPRASKAALASTAEFGFEKTRSSVTRPAPSSPATPRESSPGTSVSREFGFER